MKKTTEFLKYEFTREEREELSQELARAIRELEQRKLSKKEVVKQLDGEIASLESTVSATAEKVKDGYEFRNIDCEIMFKPDEKIAMVQRLDTQEIVRTRKMTENELQEQLPLGGVE